MAEKEKSENQNFTLSEREMKNHIKKHNLKHRS